MAKWLSVEMGRSEPLTYPDRPNVYEGTGLPPDQRALALPLPTSDENDHSLLAPNQADEGIVRRRCAQLRELYVLARESAHHDALMHWARVRAVGNYKSPTTGSGLATAREVTMNTIMGDTCLLRVK